MKTVVTVSRIVVGLIFIFSGFVKGIDPLGTMFKIEDYIYAYNMDWAIIAALPLSMLLCTIEFTLGVSILFNIWVKHTKWLLFAMMLFFTATTLFDAIYNLVPDCGCFGEAIKLSPWQTFWKNVVLMSLTLIIVMFHHEKKSRKRKPIFPKIALLMAFLLFGGFSYWSYANLPLIDFMDWKVGKEVYPKMLPLEHYFEYSNIETGEHKKWLDSEVPYEDSTFNAIWVYDTLIVVDKNEVRYTGDLHLYNDSGIEITEMYLRNSRTQYMITSYDASSLTNKAIDNMVEFEKELLDRNIDVVVLANGMQQDIDKLKGKLRSQLFNVDDTVLKMMVRANPGVIIFKEGIVVDKYNLNNGKFR